MKKMLFVSPDTRKEAELISHTRVGGAVYFSPPLGVMRLAGYLKSKGHDAEYYDPNLYFIRRTGLSPEEKLLEKDWDYIGFSVLEESLMQDIQNMYLAKKLRPNAMIVAGGIEAQFNYQTLLDKSPCRIVILGEGEEPMLRLANGDPWHEIPGIVVKNLAQPMSQELFNEATSKIQWETIPYEQYWDTYREVYGDQWNEEIERQIHTIRIFSRNRCPIGCKFCSSTFQLTLASGQKVPVISNTEENLISIVERCVEAHPEVKQIYFTDDDFCIAKRSVIRFCQQVIERDFGDLRFMSFARITDLDENVIEWMARANFFKLNIGVESFSQPVLDEMGKRCDVNLIEPTLKLLKKYGIRPYFNIILSTPKSTIDDIEITLDRVEHYIVDPYFQATIIPAIKPLRGTEFAEMYWDFASEVVQVPGTPHFLRRDEYIQPEDPVVREFNTRYSSGVDAVVDNFVKAADIRHKTGASLALAKCRFAREIVANLRAEYGLYPQRSSAG